MTPLGIMAWGIGIVIFDLRIDGFDYIVDVVGWALCAVAAARLGSASRWFHVAMWTAILGGIASLSEIFDVEQSPWFVVSESLTLLVLAWSVCTGIMEVLSRTPERSFELHPRRIEQANRIRWTVAVTSVILGLLAPLMTAIDAGSGALILLPVVVVGLIAYVWFLVFVARMRHNPALQGGTRTVPAA